MGTLVGVFYEEIGDSGIDKFIMSLNALKPIELHPIYHVDPEEELLITFEDDDPIEKTRTFALAKISNAKGNEGTPHFIDTDTPDLSLKELVDSITRKCDENVSKRNNETLHPKDILLLESTSNMYETRCSVSNIDFNSNKYDRSDIEKSCARNDKQDINLRNYIYEFVLDEIRCFEGKNSFKK